MSPPSTSCSIRAGASPLVGFLVVSTLALAAGCGGGGVPTGLDPTADDSTRDDPTDAGRTGSVESRAVSGDTLDIVLARGEETVIGDAFRISFSDVTEDSRCPVDVDCVWQGNAAVVLELSVGTGPTRAFTVNTGVEPRAVEHGSYRVGLEELRPRPISTASIDLESYRAHLLVTTVD